MAPKLPLPRGWKRRVRSSVLHILAVGHYSVRPGQDSHLLEQRTFVRHTWTSTAANLRVLHQATELQLELDGA